MQGKINENTSFKFLNILIDTILLIVLFCLFLYIHNPGWEYSLYGIKVFFFVQYKSLVLILLSWFIIAQNLKYYKQNVELKLGWFFKTSILQALFFSIALFAISGIKDENLYSNFETLGFSILFFFYSIISKLLIYIVNQIKLRNGSYLKNAIILGENRATENFKKTLKAKDKLIFIEKIYNIKTFNVDEYINHLRNPKLEIIFLSLNSGFTEEQIDFIIYQAQNNYKKIKFISDTFLDFNHNLEVEYYDTFPILSFIRYPLDSVRNQLLKRIFDIIFSLFVLLFLIPIVYPIISIFIYIDSGFPLLYKQKRNGLFGKEFLCLKFRTMQPNIDNDIKATVRGDSRVTNIGKILRKTSLDELPQFINVLRGDMSIVGPRPHMISQDEHYAKILNKYTLRHYVKPGITGLAQVKGYRGEINCDHDMELRIMADIYYVKNWSFYIDMIIIVKTVIKMATGDKNAI